MFDLLETKFSSNGWCYLMGVMPDIGASSMYLPSWARGVYMLSQLLFRSSRDGVGGMADVVRQARRVVQERWEEMQKKQHQQGEVQADDDDGDSDGDILTTLLKLVQTQENEKEKEKEKENQKTWTTTDTATEIWAVIWAGSDTTATALSSIFYHVHKHRRALSTLRAKIDSAFTENRLSMPIRYTDARKLPYLHAVIVESMRVHTALGLGLPRVSPPQGARVGGVFIPGGVEVTVNPAAMHFDERVFGSDAAQRNPERWFGEDGKVRRMERCMMHFGHGPRMCIGRHISMMEMYKLVSVLLREFEFELVVEEWVVRGSWFHRPGGVHCRVRERTLA